MRASQRFLEGSHQMACQRLADEVVFKFAHDATDRQEYRKDATDLHDSRMQRSSKYVI